MNDSVLTAWVGSRFERAAESYTRTATVQRLMAKELAAKIARTKPDGAQRVFEVGCGTGIFSEVLSTYLRPLDWFLNDLFETPRLVSILSAKRKARWHFLRGDIEAFPSFPADLDLIASNAAVHWLKDLSSFFRKSAEALNDDGLLALSTFGPGNFSEIRATTGIGLEYHDEQALRRMSAELFEVVEIQLKRVTVRFDRPISVLRHLRDTGVNSLDSKPWTRADLAQFAQRYDLLKAGSKGYPLTYDVIYALFRKKPL